MDTWQEKKAELTLVELQVILRFKELVRMVPSLVELVKQEKAFRTALRPLLINSADGRMVSRLTQAMVKVIQADLVSEEVCVT
jgi:hypothetical protein